MKPIAFRSIAAASALLLASILLQAEERPRYGGTLRVQLKEPVLSLDPGDGKDLTLTRQRLVSLLYDRLTRIDGKGRVVPGLATTWTSDASRKSWRFTLRTGLVFHDGTPLTAAHVLQVFANDARWQVRGGNGPLVIVFDCPAPIVDLPAVLAGARYSIVLRTPEGPQGTGPFKVAAWQPGRQLSLTANLDYFAGRPYLDGAEIHMANSLREQMVDLRLDRDDLVEVDIDQSRRLEAASQRVDTSSPGRLLAVVFPGKDDRVRELLSRSIDRDSIHAAILKKTGAPASSLLPQWLSGYALLFDREREPARVQKLRGDLGKPQPLYLAYDSADPVQRSVAERIAVNARDVGLTVQVFGEKNASLARSADAVLAFLPIGSAHATQALVQIADAGGLDDAGAEAAILAAASPEELYAAESAALEKYIVIPVAHLPLSVWVSSRVRNWQNSPEGGWRLEEVWLESNK